MTTIVAFGIALQVACVPCLLYCSWALFTLSRTKIHDPKFDEKMAQFDRRFTARRVVLIGVVSFVGVFAGLLS